MTQPTPTLTSYSLLHYDVIVDPQVIDHRTGYKVPARTRPGAIAIPSRLHKLAVPSSGSVWYFSIGNENAIRELMARYKADLRRWYIVHNMVDAQNGQIVLDAIKTALDEQVAKMPTSLGESVRAIEKNLDQLESKDAEAKLKTVYKRVRARLQDVVTAAATFAIIWQGSDLLDAVIRDLEARFETARAEIALHYKDNDPLFVQEAKTND